ncbi:hypothetical protein AGABI2DRAFT_222948 [Agaricus bisporus var. bisporus H97]|uniref:hypothetical protein n=1 Tax=Agaricus bisporus var. bisporus (strain H97 / ATCC MYA-4626 / FGSC 10389) TaxID=936046 RepID=UPI00029F68A1|nr:hypothetical protein AGABI2DRAFT_222948 [Agaricus bisporus var. bisporus H97]EKV46599.1 hypothetical protein AGABI2DRAFT_222948 [Agaricus bisporus var. bisporus H97]
MPSLPEVPAFEDSADVDPSSSRLLPQESDDTTDEEDLLRSVSSTRHSTPAASQYASTIRPFGSANSTPRFPGSFGSRKSFVASPGLGLRASPRDNLGINKRSPLSRIELAVDADDDDEISGHDLGQESKSSVPDVYLPPPDDEDEEDNSITDALQSISRTSSPAPFAADASEEDELPNEYNDYPVSVKSEVNRSPFDRYQNVAIRRAMNRTRTPSLTHTLSSQSTSPTNSTPHSNHSVSLVRSHTASPSLATRVPLPRSRTNSPMVKEESSPDQSSISNRDASGAESMDVTDVHSSSPMRVSRSQDSVPEELEGSSNNSRSAEEREPTFSSDGGPTPYSVRSGREPVSSPGSLAFTPTPAFPRPRARFQLPSAPKDVIPSTPVQDFDETSEHQGDEIITPHTRRRSFLLSVINSTARPRIKKGTPHPRFFATPGMASIVESTPGPSKGAILGEGVSFSTVLAGVTPRPPIATGRRNSHPLAQAYAPSPAASETGTPAAYENDDRMSMVSTTSSQDLTTNRRANASFDPAMGFGVGATGHGVGRFNAGKLNNYLHTLNRRLQEENEVLLERLKTLEEKQELLASPDASGSSRRLSRGSAESRRLSAGTSLNDVKEDPTAEVWLEEKAELEGVIESYKDEVANFMAEKEDIENALENEKHERERDKERWKERMAEVEAGVSELVGQLEMKVEAAEKQAREVAVESEERLKEVMYEVEDLHAQLNSVNGRAEKAEQALESGKDLGGALNEANEKLVHLASELRAANNHIRDLEKDAKDTDTHIHDLESLNKKDQELIATFENEVETVTEQLEAERARVRELEERIKNSGEELQELKTYAEQLEDNAETVVGRLETLEFDIAEKQKTIQKLHADERESKQQILQLEDECAKAQEVNAQMEEALEEAEKKMFQEGEEIDGLKSEIAALEREKHRVMVNASQSVSRSLEPSGPTEEDLEALEMELDSAHKEITRLTSLLAQSPARKAMEKAKETRIELLEKEREELLERNKALRLTMNEMATPHKIMNTSGISPIHRQVLSMSLRAPRTPGPPLRDLSWLNGTINDPTVSPLVAEIGRLQRELDRANENIDDKIDKLEDAGLGVVGLTRKLEDARAEIASLEDEITRLRRTEERRTRRMDRMRCRKCKSKVDARQILEEDESVLDASRDYDISESPVASNRTAEVLRQDLQAVNEELAELKTLWKEEKKTFVSEKAILRDAANRLNAQVKEEARRLAETERKGEKKRLTVENELESARNAIQELEGELKSERSRLRKLNSQQNHTRRDKDDLLNQLKRTESANIRNQLNKFKQENNELEKELRENATAEQKARLLQKRVAENQKTIESLRQERANLSNDFKDLQRRYSETSERADRLRKEYTTSSKGHEHRRDQLDVCLLEIEDLKRALKNQNSKVLQFEEEKEKIMAEKKDVTKAISVLEADLRRVRRDAETFGRDLRKLRTEKETAETKHKDEITRLQRSKKQAQTQLRLVNEELNWHKEQTATTKDFNRAYAANENQLSAVKLQHNKECKGLIVQIRYLKAKFTREALFRDHLGYQKQYLLTILSQFEKSEQRILVSISRIGYPVPSSKAKKFNKFKTVACLAIFISRAQRASAAWKELSRSKQEVVAALGDMHRRRAIASTS